MKPFLLVLTICSILITILAPPEIALAGIFLLFLIPGFVIVSFLSPQKDFVDQVVLTVVAGLAFQIVYAYMLSLKFHFSLLSLFLPSLCCALLHDFKGSWNYCINRRAFLILLPAVIFVMLTLNMVPGEDAIAHKLITDDIVEAKAIPETYLLYPEIPTLMYPVGFHVLTAQLQLFSGIDNLMFGVASLLTGILCLSVYWCSKQLFSIECGLLAGTLTVFATLPPVNSLILSNYTTLLAYIFTCAAIGVAVNIIRSDFSHTNLTNTGFKPFIILSLILTGGVETHLLFFVVLIPISAFLIQNLVKKGLHEVLNYGYTLVLATILSLPLLIRLAEYHTPEETIQYVIEQEHHYFLHLTPEMIPLNVGIWITLVGVLGIFLLNNYRMLFGFWIGIFFFLALNTVLQIEFPLWYTFFAPRMVDQLFLPFSILGAFFLTQIWKSSKVGVILLSGIILLSGSLYVARVPRANRGELFPTTSPFFETDQEGMVWLKTSKEDAVVLNDWWTGTGSAWIPSLTRRHVIFPYTVNAFSVNMYTLDNYIKMMNLAEKERKSFIIAAFPDSEEAHQYLKELKVDYIFLSSYVLEESKWRNALWNPFVLEESPNYTTVFQEGYTYIFEVAPVFEYSTSFVLREYPFFTSDNPVLVDVSLNLVSFPVDVVLDIVYEDYGWGTIEIRTESALLAGIPLTNTKENVHVAFRIPQNTTEISIQAEEPIKMKGALLCAFRDSFSLHNNALVGKWEKSPEGYALLDEGHIYVINTSKTLEIVYMDKGEGNVDFNMFVNGEWQKLTTLYRENDGETKTLSLSIPEGYTVLDIGVNTWGDPFIIIELSHNHSFMI